jgi:hypothetical protein
MDWKCGTSGRVPSSTSQDTWCPVFPALRQLPFTVGTHSCLHGRPGSPESPWAQPPPLTSHWTEPPEVGALSITVPATAILKLSHCDSHPYGPGYHKGSISVSVPFIHSFVHSTSTFWVWPPRVEISSFQTWAYFLGPRVIQGCGARYQWLMPVIQATWEAEIRRIMVIPGKWFLRPPCSKQRKQNGLDLWLKC